MSLKKKRSGKKFSLVRSTWHRVQVQHVGETIVRIPGHAQETYLGQLDVDTVEIPRDFVERHALTEEEVAFIEREICAPARLHREARAFAMVERDRDANWRVDGACREIADAYECISRGGRVEVKTLETLSNEVQRLIALAREKGVQVFSVEMDPMDMVLHSLESAATAVRNHYYGKNDGGVTRSLTPAVQWKRATELFSGSSESLMSELQRAGYVKVRAASKSRRAGGVK